MKDELRTIWARRVAVKSAGIHRSSLTIERIFDEYKLYTGSRKFFALLVQLLDENIEALAGFTEMLDRNGVSPYDNKFLMDQITTAKETTWCVLEKITKHVKDRLGVDLWSNDAQNPQC